MQLDHIVLTVRSIDETIDFYRRVIGLEATTFGDGRRALRIGAQKVNLHEAGHEFEPKARQPTPGSGDFCIVIDEPLDDVVADSPPAPPVPVSVWQPWRLEPITNAPVRAPIPTKTNALRPFM